MLTKYPRYTYIPLIVDADISQCSIIQALKQLDFELDREYTIHIPRNYIGFLPTITQGLLNIKAELTEFKDPDMWYIVCPATKRIIYSQGA